VGVGLIAVLVVLAVPQGAANFSEWATLDMRFRLFAGMRKPNPQIELVAIDQKSLNFYKKRMQVSWPWPRNFYEILVDYLKAGGARAVLFDVTFTEPSPDTKETDGAEADQGFAAAIARAGNVHLATQLLAAEDAEQDNETAAETRLLWPSQSGNKLIYRHGILPLPVLQSGARGLGVVNHVHDEDEICRRVPLVYGFRDGSLPNLAYGAYVRLLPTDTLDPARLGIPAQDGRFLVTWYGAPGPGGSFPYTSIHALMISAAKLRMGQTPDVSPQAFKDKIVIVGGTAAGLYDVRATPMSRLQSFPGMEIHATVLSNLLERHFLRPLPPTLAWLWTAGVALLIGLIFMVVRNQALSLSLVGGVLAAVILVGLGAFRVWLVWVPMAAPLAAGVLSLGLGAMASYRIEGKRRRQVRNLFSRYLAPEVVRELLVDPDRVGLGGKEVEATIFFSDVKDFTNISEKLAPTVLIEHLNRYFDASSNALLARKALIDKYIGDAIMAVFGAPTEDPEHAISACLAALQLAELGRRMPGDPVFFTRMGLNSGRVVVGNVGSHKRLSYTAIGDNVNLASRLEGVNKQYGTQILLSESTFVRAQSAIEARELDFIRVKGKAQPTRIYELVAEKGALAPQTVSLHATFAEGLALYRAQRWDEAQAAFRRALQIAPDDGPSRVFVDRVSKLAGAGLPTDWDGVYEFTSK
jgi:adenylate cyclase